MVRQDHPIDAPRPRSCARFRLLHWRKLRGGVPHRDRSLDVSARPAGLLHHEMCVRI